MQIRTLWITRKDFSNSPELVEAWDENSVDNWYEGWAAACDKALESIGDDLEEHRYITLNVPAKALREAFFPPSVDVEVGHE
jgi:hypothetical protein